MKSGIIRSWLIACAIGCFLMPLAGLADAASTSAFSDIAQQDNEEGNYIVVFDEPGLMHYEGGIADLRATAVTATGQRKIDATSPASQAYLEHLAVSHAARIAAIEAHVGRQLGQIYRYDIAFSGIGISLSANEASALRSVEGIKAVNWAPDREIDTFRGPKFIGAGSIWDGTATPGGVTSRGEGVVIGVIDSGINRAHPSFGVLPAECGAQAGEAKLIAYNCLSGVCTTSDEPGATCANNSEGTAEDCEGHGSHTASTAGGNTVSADGPAPAPVLDISGVASCARINSYKVCGTDTCDGLAIAAAINRAIFDGVDVINFSISGGGGTDASIWEPAGTSDRMFLEALNAGILVAASAGNTRLDNPTPVGDVNHRGPWLTTVAASTHDEVIAVPGSIQVTGPGAVPENLSTPINLISSSSPVQIVEDSALLIRDFPAAPTGCNVDPAYPVDYFAGGTALISRGACNFTEKVANAVAAGATAVIVYNNAPGGIAMGGLEAATVPAYSIQQTQGQALVAFSSTLGGAPIEATGQPPRMQADVLAGFSLRGPMSPVPSGAQGSNNSFDVTKPDITAPGVDIYAATATPSYDFYSGTSMSSPHIAGAFALLRATRPDWSASEIKSALMLTAFNGGSKEDGVTPWDADEVGNGRADLTKAALAGLVMDETYGAFLAANPEIGGDPRTLNLPSVRHSDCSPSCSWTRTVRNTLPGASEWTASGLSLGSNFDIEVVPASFSFNGDGIPSPDTLFANGFEEGDPLPETQEIVITVTPTQDLTGAIVFGEVELTEVNDRSPDLRLPVAVGQPAVVVPLTCLGLEGFTSNGAAFSGDPNNTVIELPIGVGNELSGLAADVRVEGFAPSWLDDSSLLFSSTINDGQGIALRPGANINNPGVVEASSSVIFADLALPNVVPAADGILRLEWFEGFLDGAVDPDSEWNNASDPFVCPGLRLLCLDQAACDQAVENFQP